MIKIDLEKLSISMLAPFGAGIIGAAATARRLPVWYDSLNKPFFNPPNNIFGIVWPILYLIMGVSLYLVWLKGWDKREVRTAVTLFFVHLMVNSLWSLVFFGLRNPLLGLFTILALLILIVVLMMKFYKIEKVASWLLMPYLLWVIFASFLNFSIWYLNR
ncbi:hypothetical protein A2V61_01235 [Candidatus Woesebacteria bacterium RBG_19FT_COMBO_47_8]